MGGSVNEFLRRTLLFLLLVLFIRNVYSDLIVNVRNQGGDIYQEEIVSDVNEETISLSFESPDGSTVLQFIDFKNEIQVLQTNVLGEEELSGDPPFMSYCFVTKFLKGDFIPPDAMAKLRQKNPWSIRIPERQLSYPTSPDSDLLTHPNSTLDSLLDKTSTDWISPHIQTICKDSVTYASKLDLMSNFQENGNNSENFLRAVRPVISATIDCSAVTRSSGVPCVCSRPICIIWFPCALKYCRTKNQGEDSSSFKTYRCGIHTCKSCRSYLFSVSNKFNCL